MVSRCFNSRFASLAELIGGQLPNCQRSKSSRRPNQSSFSGKHVILPELDGSSTGREKIPQPADYLQNWLKLPAFRSVLKATLSVSERRILGQDTQLEKGCQRTFRRPIRACFIGSFRPFLRGQFVMPHSLRRFRDWQNYWTSICRGQ